ncbi:MAG TPA: hypothetical protein VJT13_21160, partial [Xanthobacteraceae bacterium]|nr:hypothetical protein [Xanthobacteraceae bacterium]
MADARISRCLPVVKSAIIGAKRLEHDPEKHVLDPDRGWIPVFGKDHAQRRCRNGGDAMIRAGALIVAALLSVPAHAADKWVTSWA